jgi:hypothetical protein
MSKYPEHDKMKAVKDLAQAAGDFIEWLREHVYSIAQWTAHEGLCPERRSTEAWMADWLGIDLVKLDKEKTLMLDEVRREKEHTYEIWVEGYRHSGESDVAVFLGTMSGGDFKEACTKWFVQNADEMGFFDAEKMTCWGCRLFDNEADARRLFG